MRPDHATFLGLSAELTGYSAIALEGTGLVDEHQALLEAVIGADVAAELYTVARMALQQRTPEARVRAIQVDILPSLLLWPVASSLLQLWYTGQWNQLPGSWYQLANRPPPKPGSGDPGLTHVPSMRAYTQQLSYRTAGAHPPGANPTGFASWSLPPVFDDDYVPIRIAASSTR